MKLKYMLFLALIMTYGCSEKGVNPCELLTLEEVRLVAPDAQAYEYHSASTSKNKDNELCLWHDGGDRNVFMLFYYASSPDPHDLVRSVLPDDSRILDVSDISGSAVAGFVEEDSSQTGSLKVFSAKSNNKTIGIRVQGISDENSEKFKHLKEISAKALSRI